MRAHLRDFVDHMLRRDITPLQMLVVIVWLTVSDYLDGWWLWVGIVAMLAVAFWLIPPLVNWHDGVTEGERQKDQRNLQAKWRARRGRGEAVN